MINLSFLPLPRALQTSTNVILICGRTKKQELAKGVIFMEHQSQEKVHSYQLQDITIPPTPSQERTSHNQLGRR